MRRAFAGALLALAFAGPPARAADEPPIQVVIKNHQFSPAEINVTSGKSHLLEIANQDDQPEEFEMRQLAIEKVIPANGHGIVRLRPLGPGRYNFFGDFHPDTAQGTIVSNEAK
jgi:hypothetical protein